MSGQQRNSRHEGSFSRHPDPLRQAFRVQEEAAALNFDWPDASGALEKLREEIAELEALLLRSGEAPEGERAIQEEVGDLLFAAVNVARLCGVAPDGTLSRATRKFQRRFEALLERAEGLELDPRSASLEQLDELWETVKRREQADPS